MHKLNGLGHSKEAHPDKRVHLKIGAQYYITAVSIGRVDNSLFANDQSRYHEPSSRSIIGRNECAHRSELQRDVKALLTVHLEFPTRTHTAARMLSHNAHMKHGYRDTQKEAFEVEIDIV